MKRLYKAIYEGLNNKLIDFGDAKLKKSQDINNGKVLKLFKFGDYVYKDPKLGYNNYIGKKMAICVNDVADEEMYVVLNHKLMSRNFSWANENTLLFEKVTDFEDGWLNTLNILNTYSNDINRTIWSKLKDDEYIPAEKELKTIYNNCKGTRVWDLIGFEPCEYWNSSPSLDAASYNTAGIIDFNDGRCYVDFKDSIYKSVVLLNLDR